jgi:hypothetical protein
MSIFEEDEMKIRNRAMWQDLHGQRHIQHVVRSLGPGRGFGVLDVRLNAIVVGSDGYATREQAWEDLKQYEDRQCNRKKPTRERSSVA